MRPTNRRAVIDGLDESLIAIEKRNKARERLARIRASLKKRASVEFEKKSKGDREKMLKVKEFFRKFNRYKKMEYSKEIWLSIKHSSLLFPKSQLLEAQRRLRRKGVSFEQSLLERVVILPQKEYLEFEKVVDQKESIGMHYYGIVFVSELVLKRKGVVPEVSHEVGHLIDYFAGVYRESKSAEAMSEARALFSFSLVSQKARQKSLNHAIREFKSKTSTPEYIEGTNLGRAIFKLADSIRRENGTSEAQKFICEIAKNEELNDGLVRVLYQKAIDGL